MTFTRFKNVLDTLMSLVVIAAATAFVWSLFFKRSGADASFAPVQDVSESIGSESLLNVIGNGPIALVEFGDFECPFCAKQANETFPRLQRELVESGRVRYIAINLPIKSHPSAIPAAEAAECAAAQGKYWQMRRELFANAQNLASADFLGYAADLGLDVERFRTCLDSDTTLAKIEADLALSVRLGVSSTPTLFIGRTKADGSIRLLRRLNGSRPAETLLVEVANLEG